MSEYLGLSTIDNPKDGPMQDVHWPSGAFGYFPSYTLGAMIAAQQWAAIESDQPNARDDMRKGGFVRHQRLAPRQHLVAGLDPLDPRTDARATGETLKAKYFTEHLRKRYLG